MRDHEAIDMHDGHVPLEGLTQDGHTVAAGDIVWVKHDDGSVESKEVKEVVNNRKVTYVHPDSQGYIGAKLSIVYKHQDNIPKEAEDA